LTKKKKKKKTAFYCSQAIDTWACQESRKKN
jgi:hypothetical protein